MFYWLQTRFQKHFKWLFVIILGLVSISFVLTVGNHSPLDAGARGGVEVNDFYGVNINSRPELEPYIRNASITNVLDSGRPLSQEQSGMAIQSRIALLWLADQIELPSPTKLELQAYIKDRTIFKNPDGSFNTDAYDRFRLEFLPNYDYEDEDFVLMMEENYRIEKARDLATGPGYTLPFEAKFSLEERRTKWSILLASTSLDEFSPEIEVKEDELNAFYFDRLSSYKTDAKIMGATVLFPFANYTATLPEPSDDQLKVFFSLNEFLFDEYRPETVEGEDASTFAYSDVPRDFLISAYNKDAARPVAESAAQGFVLSLHENKVAYGSEEFDRLLEDSGLVLGEAETFSEANNDGAITIPRELRGQLFKLQGRRYFSDPLAVDDGILVAFTAEYFPAETPALEEVKDEVTADFKKEKKQELFEKHGKELVESLSTLTSGSEFKSSAEEAGLKVMEFSSFTPSELPTEFPPVLLSQIQDVSAGEVSEFMDAGQDGHIVYVLEKEIPEISSDDPELEQTLEQTAQFSQQINQYLFTKQLIQNGSSEEEEVIQ